VGQPFRSARLKLDRASEHIEAVEDLVECWLGTDAYTIRRDVDPETGYTVARAQVKGPPPPRLGILAGDVVQNLRSTLDHSVYALAERQPGGISRADEHTLMFPVVGNENSKGEPAVGRDIFPGLARRLLPGVTDPARAFIEQEQPYHWDDGYVHHWLWLIDDLNRIDKHRRLAVTSAFLHDQFVTTPANLDPRISFHQAEGPIANNDKLVTYSGSEKGVGAHFTRGISLDEGVAANSGVGELLRNLESRIKWMVDILESLG
jgi:hypothetical protein